MDMLNGNLSHLKLSLCPKTIIKTTMLSTLCPQRTRLVMDTRKFPLRFLGRCTRSYVKIPKL